MSRLEGRLRVAAILVLVGLVIQLLTLMWNHPLAFMTFLFIGSPLVVGGIGVYLWSLLPPS